jgi:Flp pilus assembly protein TadB
MVSALAVAVAVLARMGWLRLSLLVGSMYLPVPTGLLLIALAIGRRRVEAADAASFCDAVSKELRAGESVRDAIRLAAESVGADQIAETCAATSRLDLIGMAAARQFEEIGEELMAVVRRRDGLGVRPAVMFEELVQVALARSEVRHEVSIATAPARATAAVLLLAPLGALAWVVANGELSASLARPEQRFAAAIGLALVVTGLVLATAILRRST